MDEEIALQVLLHCQMQTELALAKFRQLPVKTICKNFAVEMEERERGLKMTCRFLSRMVIR